MYFFTSDIHFEDNKKLRIDNRPFKNVKCFNKFIIKQCNKQAKKDDTIFVIGDWMDCNNAQNYTWKTALPLVKKIKANVILITGNNEERAIKFFFNDDYQSFVDYCKNLGFKDVLKNTIITFNNKEFYLTHEPKDHNPDYINLFGHIHRAGGVWKPYGLNVGCDLNHYMLYSESDIEFLLMLKQKYWDKDKNLVI